MAEALNLVDDSRPRRREQALDLLATLARETPFPGAPRVGLTGAPGAGKSTLLDALVRALRARGRFALLPQCVRTSGRRYRANGPAVTVLRHQLVLAAYFLGVDRARIAGWYRASARR